jgi:hypothetical protein
MESGKFWTRKGELGRSFVSLGRASCVTGPSINVLITGLLAINMLWRFVSHHTRLKGLETIWDTSSSSEYPFLASNPLLIIWNKDPSDPVFGSRRSFIGALRSVYILDMDVLKALHIISDYDQCV